MAVQVGKRYYVLLHAYHHFCGEVGEILGKRHCTLVQHKHGVVRVQSCGRGWTEFFRDGFKDDTVYTFWPGGMEIEGWFAAVPFDHPIPLPPEASRGSGRQRG